MHFFETKIKKGCLHMSDRTAESMMDKTIEKIKAMVDANTIIGSPIQAGEVTVIPVSKVTYGFAAGGSDLPSKTTTRELFGGGGGAGVTIAPIAFLTVSGGNVKLLPVNPPVTTADRIVEMVPEAVDKISGFVKSRKKEKDSDLEDVSEKIAEKAVAEINEKLGE